MKTWPVTETIRYKNRTVEAFYDKKPANYKKKINKWITHKIRDGNNIKSSITINLDNRMLRDIGTWEGWLKINYRRKYSPLADQSPGQISTHRVKDRGRPKMN